jgi:DnaK suppressor protein
MCSPREGKIMSKKSKQSEEVEFLQEIERRLRAESAHLASQLRGEFGDSIQSNYADLVGEVRDAADQSNAEIMADTERADIVRHSDSLNAADAALGRIRDGIYGICADCGGKIGNDRLRVFPVATRCVVCQTKIEKQQLGSNGSSL